MYKLREVLLSTLVIGLIVLATPADQAHAFSVRENSPSGTVVGSDLNHFSINGSTGQLKTGEVLDYETQSTYEVVVAKAHIDSNDVATYSEEEFKTVIISVTEKPRRCLRRGGD